eukprot:gene13659-16142_t
MGAAYYDPRGDGEPGIWQGTWTEGGHLTINRGELVAIHAALRARELTPPTSVGLCSMYRIRNMLVRPHIMDGHRHRDLREDILFLVELHNSTGTWISVRKVKSHTGIRRGNDKADEAAKAAAENQEGTAAIDPWDNRIIFALAQPTPEKETPCDR